MTYPENLKYAKSHEWVEFLEDGSARIGMTDYAQDQMGDLVFVNLPEPPKVIRFCIDPDTSLTYIRYFSYSNSQGFPLQNRISPFVRLIIIENTVPIRSPFSSFSSS